MASPPANTHVIGADGKMSQAWIAYLQESGTAGLAAATAQAAADAAQSTATAAQTSAAAALAAISALTIANTWVIGDLRASSLSSLGSNWLLCDGTDASNTTYATLYGVIGSITGPGAGAGTFKLPSLPATYDVASPGPGGPPIMQWWIRAL